MKTKKELEELNKQQQDKEMNKLDSEIKFNEKEFWENRTKTYIEETKHIDKWHKQINPNN
jgi:hypothetical protein